MSVSLSSIVDGRPPAAKKRRLGRTVMSSRVSYRPLLVGAYEYFQKEMLNELINLKPKTHYQTASLNAGTAKDAISLSQSAKAALYHEAQQSKRK